MNNLSDSLSFGEFSFPFNPHRITVRSDRRVGQLPRPGFADAVQDLGSAPCIIVGEGEFFGPTAMTLFSQLAALQKDGPNRLSVPGFEPMTAVLSRLKMIGEPGPGWVGYEFEFIEVPREVPTVPASSTAVSYANHAQFSHVVQEGESLWEVSVRLGVPLDRLLEHNPQIKNPARLSAGIIRL